MSAEELFDVVDDLDRVVQVMTRSEVHRRKLKHRAVHVFVFRSDGHLLIHKRPASKTEFPSVWTSSASGHVSSGESYSESVQRELEEELGIRAEVQFVLKVDACEATCFEFTGLYRLIWDGPIKPDPLEIDAVEWVPRHELDERMQRTPDLFSPAFRLLWREYSQLPGIQADTNDTSPPGISGR